MEQHEQYQLENKEDSKSNQPDSFFIEELKKDWGSSTTEVYTYKDLRVKETIFINRSETFLRKGQRLNRFAFDTTLTGSIYSVAIQDFLIGVTNLSYAASVGLPKPLLIGPGKHYIVKDEVGNAGTTTITIRSEGEKSIDGASSATINTNYGVREFYTDGANWFTK